MSELRLKQHQELLATGAGSSFDVERYETEVASGRDQLASARAQENQALLNLRAQVGDTQSRVAQVLAQLESAQFDLESCTVQTPAEGFVSMNMLRPGMQVSPSRSVMAFVYTDTVEIGGLFAQKALENIAIGNKAQISFPTLPGRLFQGEVVQIPNAVGNAQFYASGQLEWVTANRMSRLYPIFISLPEDFPEELIKLGLAADVCIFSDSAGIVGIVATITQWIKTSLDYVV